MLYCGSLMAIFTASLREMKSRPFPPIIPLGLRGARLGRSFARVDGPRRDVEGAGGSSTVSSAASFASFATGEGAALVSALVS